MKRDDRGDAGGMPPTAKRQPPAKLATAKLPSMKQPSTGRKPATARATGTTRKTAAAKRGKPARRDPARVAAILDALEALYPEADCELSHGGPWQLLVATILSAQCTDKVVNTVTPALFARYPDAAALAAAEPSDVEPLVARTGFFRQKAKNIVAASRLLSREHDGKVPRTMEAMLSLPGVARKTANVVLGTGYGIASGVVVDTHIARLSRRLGLTTEEDPVKIELDLMDLVPRERWIKFGHQLIWHGRRVCGARRPMCEACSLAPRCPSAFRV